MPGTWSHLAGRLWEGIRTIPLDRSESLWVERRLNGPEWAAFCEQSPADQRHGYSAARKVEAALRARPDAVRAALLHDIGKRHARLGLAGRVLASIAIRIRAPLWARARAYRDHGLIGARELTGWVAEPLVVEFARTHHGTCPPSIDPTVWQVLCESDKPD